MRCGISGCSTSRCRSPPKRSGVRCARRMAGKDHDVDGAIQEWKPQPMSSKAPDVAKRIADELAACDVKLVASLPDNWLMGVIKLIDGDSRFTHVPVNREESA